MGNKTTEDRHTATTVKAFKKLLLDNLYHTQGANVYNASPYDIYRALAFSVRDQLVGRWRETVDAYYRADPKIVIYLSAEYLLGRQLEKNMLYTDTMKLADKVFQELDLDLDEVLELDQEPGLGNGGLGRLAACFLDSLATLSIPAIGYGIRYEFGIFRQTFEDGWQVEKADNWLRYGNPWEFPQPDDMVEIGLGGHTEHWRDPDGHQRVNWIPAETVTGEPCHMLMPGYDTSSVHTLRLWRARASEDFDFGMFNEGDYARAVESKVRSENISKALYPNDETPQGKELRLKQQYFFVACSLSDILHTFLSRAEHTLETFADKIAIQLNDTHPVVAVPEMMRLLIDEHELGWDEAWHITTRTFGYTCHTLLPEALEKWPVGLFGRVLPRHLEIVYEINARFLKEVEARFPGDNERLRRMSIIEEGTERRIRMAHLASVSSHTINGVAALQSRLLQERTLRDFAEMWPDRFQNKTNGVTPRRFMLQSNPRFSALITEKIGSGWLTHLDELSKLEKFAGQAGFRESFRKLKLASKETLAAYIFEKNGIQVDPSSLFDVMVKRLHEYKRQLLKALHIITLYQRLKRSGSTGVPPITFIFGAKAAPGYQAAKLIIKLIHGIADVVNHDADVGDALRVVFLENFNVTIGELVYPAADLSEQISLAGKEASGTGNMKFALNGTLTIGTLDGANIEIRERVGAENFFLFGLTVDEVLALKMQGYDPRRFYEENETLRAVIDALTDGTFSSGDRELFNPIVHSLLDRDEFLLLADYASYIERLDEAGRAFTDSDDWSRKALLNVARSGYFSSDRVIEEYCRDVWNASPVEVQPQDSSR